MDIFDDFRAEERRQIPRHAQQRVERLLNLEKLDRETKLGAKAKGSKLKSIQKVAISNSIVIIGIAPCSLLRLRLPLGSKDVEEIEISGKSDDLIEQIFIDHTANHVLIGLRSGDVYYLHSKALKAKKLSKFQGNVECVAFDPTATEANTKSFLVGTSTGFIYEVCLDATGKERVFQVVYQLDFAASISAIYFEMFLESEVRLNSIGNSVSSQSGQDVKYILLFATSSPTRLYHEVGGPIIQQLFVDVKERGNIAFTELPGDLQRAELLTFPLGSSLKSKSFALMTAAGIYYGPMMGFGLR